MATNPNYSPQPPWRYSAAMRGYYMYDPQTDTIAMRDGSSFYRPPHVTKESLMGASSIQPGPAGRQGGRGGHVQALGGAQAPAQPSRYQNALQPYPRHQSDLQPSGEQHIAPYGGSTLAQQPHASVAPVTQDLAAGFGGMSLAAPRPQFQSYGMDTSTQVDTEVRKGNPSQMTPQALRKQGIPVKKDVRGTGTNVSSTLDPSYRLRAPSFYVRGRVFIVLWAEPAGHNNTQVTRGTVMNEFGEPVFSKIRRFVVIRQGSSYCTALPIATYSGKGVAKPGVTKSDHAIIYTRNPPPQPLSSEAPRRGELPMQPVPIRVDPDSPQSQLDPMSRIDFRAVHTVQHNIKAKTLGFVNRPSLENLETMFRNVLGLPIPVQPSTPRAQGRQPEDDGEDGGTGDDGSGEGEGDAQDSD